MFNKNKKLSTRQNLLGYMFLSPVILFYSIFLFLPLAFSFYLSFTKWSGFNLNMIEWVGLQNYYNLFFVNKHFLDPILTNTVKFAVGTVAISFCCALAVAYMITRLRFEGFWRTLYFLPMVTTVVAIGSVWMYLYGPRNGAFNAILGKLGFEPIGFLLDPDKALMSIIVVGGWMGIGSSMIILTAGLKNISDDYYEAAMIEGASVFSMVRFITIPLLKPSILFVLITSFIGGLQSFTLTMVMTKDGGPGNSTNVIGLEMYKQAFSFGNWGTASAMAFVLYVIVLIVTLIQLFIFKRGGVESY